MNISGMYGMGENFNYLISPEIYYSSTRLNISHCIHILYHSFTVLYSHNRHAIVTYISSD